jgi:hypothetical protein
MEYDGIRIMMRDLNLKYVDAIRNKLDKNKPLQVTIDGLNKKVVGFINQKIIN